LADSHVPQKYWDEACLTSCYLINRLPTPLLQNKSPFEKLFHRTPDYKFLKVFGCACFPNLRPYNSHKFSFRSKKYVFLGYSAHHKGYKCLHIAAVPSSTDYVSPTPSSVLPPILFPASVSTRPSHPVLVSASMSSSSQSPPSSAEHSMPSSLSGPDDLHVRTHPMCTRSKRN